MFAIQSLAVRRWSDPLATPAVRLAGLLESYAHDKARRLSSEHSAYAWIVTDDGRAIATYIAGVRQSSPDSID